MKKKTNTKNTVVITHEVVKGKKYWGFDFIDSIIESSRGSLLYYFIPALILAGVIGVGYIVGRFVVPAIGNLIVGFAYGDVIILLGFTLVLSIAIPVHAKGIIEFEKWAKIIIIIGFILITILWMPTIAANAQVFKGMLGYQLNYIDYWMPYLVAPLTMIATGIIAIFVCITGGKKWKLNISNMLGGLISIGLTLTYFLLKLKTTSFWDKDCLIRFFGFLASVATTGMMFGMTTMMIDDKSKPLVWLWSSSVICGSLTCIWGAICIALLLIILGPALIQVAAGAVSGYGAGAATGGGGHSGGYYSVYKDSSNRIYTPDSFGNMHDVHGGVWEPTGDGRTYRKKK